MTPESQPPGPPPMKRGKGPPKFYSGIHYLRGRNAPKVEGEDEFRVLQPHERLVPIKSQPWPAPPTPPADPPPAG